MSGILRLAMESTDPTTAHRGMRFGMQFWSFRSSSRALYWPATRAKILLHQKWLWRQSVGLREMLLSTAVPFYAMQRCMDTHDKVYGLLGMTNSVIVPDYTKSSSELYTHALIEGAFELNILRGPSEPCKLEEPVLFIVALLAAFGVMDRRHRPTLSAITGVVIDRLGWPLKPLPITKAAFQRASNMLPRKLVPGIITRSISTALARMIFQRELPQFSLMRTTGRVLGSLTYGNRSFEGWVDYIDKVYNYLLEVEVHGQTQHKAIVQDISHLSMLTDSKTGTALVKRIGHFPIARGSAKLHERALQRILFCLTTPDEDCVGSEGGDGVSQAK